MALPCRGLRFESSSESGQKRRMQKGDVVHSSGDVVHSPEDGVRSPEDGVRSPARFGRELFHH